MKNKIEYEMKIGKKVAVLFICIGVLFALLGGILFAKKDILQIFPRMDIAWIGFSVVAFILCVMGYVYFQFLGKSKNG